MPETETGARAEPGGVAETCICLALQRAGRVVGRQFDEALRPLNLTNWQHSILSTLADGGPRTVGTLAELLGADRTTVTGNLKPLERRQLVAINTDDADRRVKVVSLSAAGRDLLAQGHRRWARVDRAMKEKLRGVDRDALLRALTALASSTEPVES